MRSTRHDARARIWRMLTILTLVLSAALCFGAASASAAFLHPKLTASFGRDGTPATPFGLFTLRRAAFDNTSQRLFVLRPSLYTPDSGNTFPPQPPRGIFAYDTSIPGTYAPLAGGFPITIFAPTVSFLNLAVDETEGNVYFVESAENDGGASSGKVFGWESSGTPLGGNFPLSLPQSACGAAVDSLGYLWLPNTTQHKVFKYSPEGVLLDSVSVAPFAPCDIAFDKSNDDMWLRQLGGGNPVARFTASSGYTEHDPPFNVTGTSNPQGIAFDSSSGILYAIGGFGELVNAYNEGGGLVEAFAPGGRYRGISINEATGDVYLSDDSDDVVEPGGFNEDPVESGKIRVWAGVVVPDVETRGPAGVGHTSATLTGHVDLAGGPNVTDCKFQYGSTTSYSSGSVPCVPAASPGSPLTGPTDVTAELSGLSTGTTYHYRLVAGNSNGTNVGVDETLIPQPSLVKTGAATNVQRTSATLNGTVDPEGLETTFYFQYGKSKSYGQTTAAPPGVSVGTTEAGDKAVSAGIGSLQPGTTYHYRLVAVNGKGTSFGVDRTFASAAAVKNLITDPATNVHRTDVTLHGTLDPDGHQTDYYFEYGKTRRYGKTTATPPGTDVGTTAPGDKALSAAIGGLVPETTYHYRLVAANSFGTTFGEDRTFTTTPAVIGLSTDPVSDIQATSATLNGKLDPDGFVTNFYFQWGKTAGYGRNVPAPPGTDVGTTAPGITPVSIALEDLEPGTTYHYRLVAANSYGTTFGADQSFSTPQAPSIEGFSSANVTETSAELKARINPHGFETTYRFQYGTTTQYGSTAPVPDGVLGTANSAQSVTVPVSGLQGVTYHFRLIAENQWGTTISEDQTFDFNPPSCPNAAVRQQTGAAYLPECRAYELVSPARAGGAALLADGPDAPHAINRFAFSAAFNAIPGAGDPPNAGINGDLYVASRTNTGWVTRYVGIPADQTISNWGVLGTGIVGASGILTDTALDRVLTWNNSEAGRSYAPYLWDNEGNGLGRLPTNLEEVPGGTDTVANGGFVGAVQPSPDFSHYVFSSRNVAFAPGGVTSAPGSVYDNDIAAETVSIASKTPVGTDIPQDATAGGSSEFIRIPAVSSDGSHILMSTLAGSGTHLYMRVNGAVTYEVSVGQDMLNHGVKFEGMTNDGSHVYFTTAGRMTADDHDSSVDLYRWSEASALLTRLSIGTEAGDTDSCNPEWGLACGVEVVPTDTHFRTGTSDKAQPIDSALASQSGDIYFYSPEQLDGARGVPDQRNLYLWREGEVRHVATLESLRGAERINVSADGSHMAFITSSKLTSYDNAGFDQMFTYDPATRKPLCVSCSPDGSPPTGDVEGSQNGLFMTDDGRAFFNTPDALVPRDANDINDVYEYVVGRAQLISSGTSDEDGADGLRPAGLVGVDASGLNAFISTYQTLVPQDENGPFFKFYSARTNGGFPFNKPAAPCAAADECHGPASSRPAPAPIGTGAQLGTGGNATATRKKKRRRGRKARHKAGKRKRGRNHSKRKSKTMPKHGRAKTRR